MAANTSSAEDCAYLRNAVDSWLFAVAQQPVTYDLIKNQQENVFLTWAQILPVRCDWQQANGLITYCPSNNTDLQELDSCPFWNSIFPTVSTQQPSRDFLADELSVREGGIVLVEKIATGRANFGTGDIDETFYVGAVWNDNQQISLTYVKSRKQRDFWPLGHLVSLNQFFASQFSELPHY
jgi:hypothetical protein